MFTSGEKWSKTNGYKKIVIGKDGRVVTAHAVSGPSNGYKVAENASREWTFQPYLVLDQPAEVETQIILNHN